MNVGIIGVGMTGFGEYWDKSFKDLVVEAGSKAIKDANIEGRDIDAAFAGSMTPGMFLSQEHVGALVADYVGLAGIPATRVEGACASGGLALQSAYQSIKSGEYDIVVAAGAEKMTDVSTGQATIALAGASDQEWEAFHGVTFPGLYALMAQRHMIEYGTTEEQLAQVAVKNHRNGALNPYAQYRREVTVKQVLESIPIADPLKLLDCSPITDGAAVVILANEEKTRRLSENPVWIKSIASATDTLALHDRESLCQTKAAALAGKKAFMKADLKPKDIGFAEVHDCFTIAEVMAVESLGFCEVGEGGVFTEKGETALDGSIPVNTSGGLKSKGHPVGATGIAQAVECVTQLRGLAGERQVKDNPRYGMSHNVGGSGATAVVTIYEGGA
ncbi:MAG: thiolase domain-containing protein [Candidatus Altiarchaeales archaeon]|nr:thiolase domain-containing protein [Candidatus Altiarchaeales archaeon]